MNMALLRLLAALSLISVSYARMVLHENRRGAPSGFISHGPAPADELLTLRVALTSNDISGLEKRLISASTPGSQNFRQWLSMEEVKSFVQPSPETVSAFTAFASSNGLNISVISPNEDWVSFTLPVSQANTLFGAKFEVFSLSSSNDTIIRTLSVSLPSELVGHVEVVHPTIAFAAFSPRLGESASGFSSLERHLYGIPATPATHSANNNTLLITGYAENWAQFADLSSFLEQFRPDMLSNTTFEVLTLDNGTNPQGPDEAPPGWQEANLDIQYAVGIATGVPVQFLSVGGVITVADFATALLDTTTFLDGLANPPSVISTSYGSNEDLFGVTMATKICNGYMALAARGISSVTGSGDGGVRGLHDLGKGCTNATFETVFPATCPYMTTVGSTIGIAPETATPVNFTGGGFSIYFPAPEYQTAAVAGFLETIPSNFTGVFNASGRAYPDLAVQGVNFKIVADGQTTTISGTSCSAPTFAAIIALINDRLIAAGKPVLGFLNPWIYSTAAKAFTDVTAGHNAGEFCPASSLGFDAVEGWDALSGFGTPIFSELLAAALG
ncbi:Family S53 protease-like protein [Mycena sanguinolenta]|uniref:tripeptidyl-peptidase II n=1 Tax=Mycena sanguinolenta TaxID=230812 RepID=A0A8H7CRY5_9AGAR|nr:Family S53 protease-like protein [Mycena sanguinolenta]